LDILRPENLKEMEPASPQIGRINGPKSRPPFDPGKTALPLGERP